MSSSKTRMKESNAIPKTFKHPAAPRLNNSRYALTMRWSLLFLAALAATAAELQVPPDVIVERSIDYTPIPHGKLAMDIVRPKTPGKYPGIVLIHGGGFSSGALDIYLPMAIRLA